MLQDSKESVSCKVETLSDEEKCEPKSKRRKTRSRNLVKYKEEEGSDGEDKDYEIREAFQ